jgi:hypothetical protein
VCTLHAAVHPRILLRRKQIRDLKQKKKQKNNDDKGTACPASAQAPRSNARATLTWKLWPSLKCPSGVPSSPSWSTSHTVSSTIRRAGLRVAQASRISRTRKLRTSRGGHAACAHIRMNTEPNEGVRRGRHTCNSRSNPFSIASCSSSARPRAKRASQPASALLARRNTELGSDAYSHSSNIDSICPGISSVRHGIKKNLERPELKGHRTHHRHLHARNRCT